MYQLSHLLTEQRSLIVNLLDTSILGDKAPGLRGHAAAGDTTKPEPFKTKFAAVDDAINTDSQEGRKRLTALLEKVEGCAVSYLLLSITLFLLFKFFNQISECCRIGNKDPHP